MTEIFKKCPKILENIRNFGNQPKILKGPKGSESGLLAQNFDFWVEYNCPMKI